MTALVQPKGPAHGFTLKKSIVSNAKEHVGATLVLNLDLLDFFPTIHFGRIRGVFSHQPFSFNAEVSAVLAQLCSHAKSLPAGAPTSPLISNLVCRGLDRDLLELAQRNKCRYTRYADDITLSTRSATFATELIAESLPVPQLGSELSAILTKHDFNPNPKKVRLRSRTDRLEVTGLVVNQKVNLPRKYVRNVRAMLNNCRRQGVSAAEDRFKQITQLKGLDPAPSLVNHLRGKLDYLSMVRGNTDSIYLRYAIELERIEQTRKFGVRIAGREVFKSTILSEAMWIIIGRNREGVEVKQGTAFGLHGFGIVTAAHVFDTDAKDPAVKWEIIKASPIDIPRKIESWQALDRVDLAIVSAKVRHTATLGVSKLQVQTGEGVVVAGFPNWSTVADKLEIQPATVIRTRIVSLVSYILTNATIREGASGGPIVDQSGGVVGVALQGPDGSAAPNGGVTIAHLEDLVLNGNQS